MAVGAKLRHLLVADKALAKSMYGSRAGN